MTKKIEGLEEAIENVGRAIGKNSGIFEIDRLTELGIWDVIEAATAYAKIQSGEYLNAIITEYAVMLMNAGYEEAGNYIIDNEPDTPVYKAMIQAGEVKE